MSHFNRQSWQKSIHFNGRGESNFPRDLFSLGTLVATVTLARFSSARHTVHLNECTYWLILFITFFPPFLKEDKYVIPDADSPPHFYHHLSPGRKSSLKDATSSGELHGRGSIWSQVSLILVPHSKCHTTLESYCWMKIKKSLLAKEHKDILLLN